MQTTLSPSRLHPVNIVYLLLILAALVGLYYPVLVALAHDWSTNDNYSHGFFIPLISGYMIFTMRMELENISLRPANWGLLLLLAGLAQLYIAKVGRNFFYKEPRSFLCF